MTQQIINVGNVANDGTGESLRSAFQAVNNNFSNIWAAGPVDSQVAIRNNMVTTNVSNQDLVLGANGIGTITVNSTVIPGINSIWDLGSANNQFDSVFARYYYGDASRMTGLPEPANLLAVSTDILPIANLAFDLGSSSQRWDTVYARDGNFSRNVTISGNLTVVGDVIEMGNSVTDSLTLNLANSAAIPVDANGAGITVGANAAIASILYNSVDNVWATNVGIDTGNIVIQGDNIFDLAGPTITNGDLTHGSTSGLDIVANGDGNATVLYNTYGNVSIFASSTGSNVHNFEFGADGNVSLPGNLSVSNDIQANSFAGDGSQLTGIDANNITGLANVAYTGDYNDLTNTPDFGDLTVDIVTTGNVTANYYIGNGVFLTDIDADSVNGAVPQVPATPYSIAQRNSNGNLQANSFVGNSVVANSVAINTLGYQQLAIAYTDGRLVGGPDLMWQFANARLWTTGLDSNGAITTSGVISAAGNITANYFIGDGSQLTGLPAGYANANVTAYGEAGWTGNIIPTGNAVYSLGNATNQWKELYVSNSTIYLNNVPIGLGPNNTLTVNGNDVVVTNGNGITTLGNLDIDGTSIGIANGSSETQIDITAGNRTWTFGTSGALDVPKFGVYEEYGRVRGNGLQLRGDTNGGGSYTYIILPNNTDSENTAVTVANDVGDVLVWANGQTWTFDKNGNLTLPNNGSIVGDTDYNPGSIQWVGNSSGDGYGYTTLQLRPDDTLGGDQYLIVDPTAPSHIHIRAGGEQDNSGTSLFLGGENSHFQVPAGSNPSVYVAANNYSWQFGTDGTLQVPGNIHGGYASPAPIISGFSSIETADGANLAGVTFAAGNVTADYFIGNGSQLTGLPASYTDSNVTTLLSALGSNIISSTGNITTTGNIAGGNISGTFVAPATTANTYVLYNDSGVVSGSGVFTFNENGNVLTIGTTGGQLRVADISTPQAGVNLRFIPSSGTTLSYGHLNPQFANTYDLGSSSSRWNNVYANVANAVNINATNITLSGTGTSVNASSGNVLTNQVTGTQFNFLNGLYTVNLNAGQATANYSLRLPANAGTNGQILTTDGSGNLSWTTSSSSYGNANVANFLVSYGSNTISTTGNITAGNLIGNISVTDNVTGALSNVELVAGDYTWTFDNTGNMVLPSNTFSVNYANGTAVSLGSNYGNSNVVSLLSAFGSNTVSTTGNVTGGNLISSGSIFGNPDLILGNTANASATKTRIVTDTTFSYIQTGNGTVGSTGNIVFSPYSSTTQRVVIDTSSGNLNASGNVTASNFIGNISIVGNVQGTTANVTLVAGSYSAVFDNTGVLTLPTVGGDEGGQLNLAAAAANTTITGPISIDVYRDKIRFFEGSANAKGVYLDLAKAPNGVGGELLYKASNLVNAGVDVTLGNLKARIPTSGNRSLQLSTVSGTYTVYGSSIYFADAVGGSRIDAGAPKTINTTPSYLNAGYNFVGGGMTDTWTIMDTGNTIAWRISLIVGSGYNNNMISIERLV